MLISPSGLIVASGIQNNIKFELKYDEKNEEYAIYMFDKKIGGV